MSKHTNALKPCPSCMEKMMGGHPVIRATFQMIQAKVPNVHVAYVFRGEAEQNEMFKKGPSVTRLQWPNSEHNKMLDGKPYSRAMDLFVLNVMGEAVWPVEVYGIIFDLILKMGAPLDWGGLWTSPCDRPHFQLKKEVPQA